jgi:site-specific DNA recombinase
MTSSPHGKIAVPHPIESKILATALEGFAKGTFVTSQGLWKRSAPEKYIAKFDEFLRDPFYCGDIEYLQWEVSRRPGQHPAIISKDIYELNQKRMNKNQVRVRRDAREDFPMRGLIICGDCSEHLTAATTTAKGKTYEYYFCQNYTCNSYRKSLKKVDVESGFEKILKENSLNSGLREVINALFEEEWRDEISTLKQEEYVGNKLMVSLQNKVEALTNMVISAKSESLRKVYESQLEKAVDELEGFDSESVSRSDLNIPYRNALSKAMRLVESPYEIWSQVDVLEKQRLFYFLFKTKIPYSHNDGYRNDKITCAVRLFEAFAGANTIDVEMGVLKPRVSTVNK